MQKINSQLQATGNALTKEAQNSGGTGQYQLNSYAFHPKSLVTTLNRFLSSSVEKHKIESLFVDLRELEKEQEQPYLGLYSSNDPNDKVRRKRVLISSDYSTAFKVKKIFSVYFELNQSRWLTENSQTKKF